MLECKIGELTAINNVCRTRGQARRKKKTTKKQRWVEVSQLLLSETVGLLIKNSALNNVCRTRGQARRKKNNKKTALGGSIPTTFV